MRPRLQAQEQTGAITREIESQGSEFRGVDQQLTSLNDAVQAFLGRIAAWAQSPTG